MKEFITAALVSKYEAFLIYIAALNICFNIRGDKVKLSNKVQIAYLKADKAHKSS